MAERQLFELASDLLAESTYCSCKHLRAALGDEVLRILSIQRPYF